MLAACYVAGCNPERPVTEPSRVARDSMAVAEQAAVDIWTAYTVAERRGKRLYDKYCAVCHGVTGEGDGFNAYNLNPQPNSFADSAYVSALTDAALGEIIARGGRGVNRSVLMPAYQATLSPDQIQYLIRYIRTFSRKPGT